MPNNVKLLSPDFHCEMTFKTAKFNLFGITKGQLTTSVAAQCGRFLGPVCDVQSFYIICSNLFTIRSPT